jgi:hypothetical protein
MAFSDSTKGGGSSGACNRLPPLLVLQLLPLLPHLQVQVWVVSLLLGHFANMLKQ